MAKEALIPIGLIPCQFSNIIMLKNDLCIKTVVAILFRKKDTKSHCRQKY